MRQALIVAKWLPDMDLNHDKQIQSLLCYRYTIGQTSVFNLESWRGESRLENTKAGAGLMDCWIDGLRGAEFLGPAGRRVWDFIDPFIRLSISPTAR